MGDLPGSLHMRATKQSREPAGKADNIVALEQAPPSPEYVPDPMKLEDHVQVCVPKPDYPKYLAPSDDDIPAEDQPLPGDASPDDDVEEEEHLAPADFTDVASLDVDHVPSAEETEPFETDESAATPLLPPAHRTTPRMSVRTQTPIPFPSEEEVARLLALPTPPPSPHTPLSSPLTSPTYAQAPLSCRAAMMRATPSHIPLPPSFLPSHIRPPHTRAAMAQMRATAPSTHHSLLPARTPPLLPIPLPALSTIRRAEIPEANIRDLLWPVDVRRRKSLEFYSRHREAQEDHVAVRDEIKILRREMLAYEQKSSETRQALARSEAHNRALEAHIAVLETQTYRYEW
ncbi:hypothetical protein Tco_0980947 [Tanacetum coccineum]